MNENRTYPQELKLLISGREKNLNTIQQEWEETTKTDMLGSGQS
jgi:hypothetical protein